MRRKSLLRTSSLAAIVVLVIVTLATQSMLMSSELDDGDQASSPNAEEITTQVNQIVEDIHAGDYAALLSSVTHETDAPLPTYQLLITGREGTIFRVECFSQDRLTGWQVDLRENGSPSMFMEGNPETRTGKAIWFHPNGKPSIYTEGVSGKRLGWYVRWNDAGVIEHEEFISDPRPFRLNANGDGPKPLNLRQEN